MASKNLVDMVNVCIWFLYDILNKQLINVTQLYSINLLELFDHFKKILCLGVFEVIVV